ncbi:MAG: hypothetical protein QOD38_107 [Acidimicrobiaceae bacterium]|jgi:hypothetical protein
MVKRVLLSFAALSLMGLFVLVSPPAAAAPTVVNGPCTGEGTFKDGGFTKTASETGVVEIPRKDDVAWQGAIAIPPTESAYSGKIELETPAGMPAISIDSWSGSSDSIANAGVKHYDIPSWVPANVEFKVKGTHTQGGITCSGFVKLKIKGSAVGPFSIASLVGTGLTGLGLLLAGRPKVGG